MLSNPEGKPFLKSISEIKKTFPTSKELGDFLIGALTSGKNVDADYTHITKALTLAREIDQGARRGDLRQFGLDSSFQLMVHDIHRPTEDDMITVPNVRTLIYSDGKHNPNDGSPLRNPYEGDEVSTLMSVFFGEEQEGAREMKSLACLCPIHKIPGFFLISNPERYQTLRHIFRMASGTSGFCARCLQEEKREFGSISY